MKTFFCSLALSLFVSCSLFPLELAAQESCPTPENSRDIIHCVLIRHPELQSQKWNLEKIPAQKKQAGQRPNPALDFDIAVGPHQTQTSIESELFFSYPFELGKKRQARLGYAKSQAGLEKIELRQAKEKILLQSLWDLHRLRQIQIEKASLKESIQTFRSVQVEYHKRAYLSPQQETSLNIFKLAVQDYVLRQKKLNHEEQKILQALQLATQLEPSHILSHLPKLPSPWPILKDSKKQREPTNSVAEEKARAQRLLADSEMNLAKSQAWSDLRIGPLLQYEKGQGSQWRYGMGLGLDLPVVNRNAGGKELAAVKQRISQSKLEQQQHLAALKKEQLIQQYQQLIQALKTAGMTRSSKAQHHQLHQSFEQGLLEPQSVIEFHRQVLELHTHRHQIEQEALFALWSVYALEGKILEEALW